MDPSDRTFQCCAHHAGRSVRKYTNLMQWKDQNTLLTLTAWANINSVSSSVLWSTTPWITNSNPPTKTIVNKVYIILEWVEINKSELSTLFLYGIGIPTFFSLFVGHELILIDFFELAQFRFYHQKNIMAIKVIGYYFFFNKTDINKMEFKYNETAFYKKQLILFTKQASPASDKISSSLMMFKSIMFAVARESLQDKIKTYFFQRLCLLSLGWNFYYLARIDNEFRNCVRSRCVQKHACHKFILWFI